MYLATVTCDRDFQQLLLQAESIQKFVEPCKHVIIVNEIHPDLDFYHKWLDQYYTKHELILLPRIQYPYPVEGFKQHLHNPGTGVEWRIQQLQKLLLAYEFDDDYVLLDSKNFFIKPISLEYYENPEFYGSGAVMIDPERKDHFKQSFTTYKKILNKPEVDICSTIATPYKIHYELLRNRCDIEKLGYYLFSPEYNKSIASEFQFYGVVISDKITEFRHSIFKPGPKIFWAWDPHVDHIGFKLREITEDGTFLTGFHRDFLNLTGPEHIKLINSWLKFTVGLDNSIIPYARDQQMSPYTI